MTVAWITYGLLVGLLIAAGARALEGVSRIAGSPVRWVWAGALVLALFLVGLAPLRPAPVSLASSTALGAAILGAASNARPATSSPGELTAALRVIRSTLAATIQRTTAAVNPHLPASFGRYALALWAAVSTLLLASFAVAYTRLLRGQRHWPTCELHGVRVRLAPDGGPAVVGVSRSEIVVPRWLLWRNAEQQRLVLAHECEHVRARDPLLLAAACAIAALLPWHPAVWWMLSRLRLAVELDCDVRVLRSGATPQTYGALLIDLAGRCSGLPVGTPALADNSSHLRWRLLAMTPLRLRFVRARTSALGAFALLALLAACAAEVPVPTEQGVTGRNGNPPSLDRTPGDAGISLAVVTTLPEMVPDTLSAVRVRLTEPDIEIVGSDTLVVRLTSAQEVIDNTM